MGPLAHFTLTRPIITLMKALLPLLAASLLAGFALTGCAAEPEPQATAPQTTAKEETTTPAPEETTEESAALPTTPAEGDEVVVFETTKGRIVIMVYPNEFPENSKNFLNLAREGFYTGTRFHRCIPGFMIQGGDPNSKTNPPAADKPWGTGGNVKDGVEVTVPFEGSNLLRHAPGVVSMAHAGNPNGASSQFFIMDGEARHLDGVHTAFGRVVEGQDVVQKIIATGDPNDNGAVNPAEAVVITNASVQKWPLEGAQE